MSANIPRPRLVEVNAYNLDTGHLIATDVSTGKQFEVRIKPTLANQPAKDQQWEGNHIDARMAEQIPVGSRVILEDSCVIPALGRKMGLLEAAWVLKTPDPRAEARTSFAPLTPKLGSELEARRQALPETESGSPPPPRPPGG